MTEPTADPPTQPPRRWRRRVALSLAALLVLVGAAVAAVLLALANLSSGLIKPRILAEARQALGGVAVDFDAARITLGGMRLTSLKVATPAPYAATAPYLLTVGAIEGDWSLLPAAVGGTARVRDLVVRDVAITIVADAEGRTSLDALLDGLPKSPPKPKKPPEPLSALTRELLPTGLAASLRVENVTVTVLRPGQTIRLTGLGLRGQLDAEHVAVALGPSELAVTVEPGGEATARLAGNASLQTAGSARAELELTLLRQTFSLELPPLAKLIDLAAAVDFAPAERKTRVNLEKVNLLDGLATFEGRAELVDQPDGTIHPVLDKADCRIALEPLAKAVPPAFGRLLVEAEPLTCRATGLELLPTLRGELAVEGKIDRLEWVGSPGTELEFAL